MRNRFLLILLGAVALAVLTSCSGVEEMKTVARIDEAPRGVGFVPDGDNLVCVFGGEDGKGPYSFREYAIPSGREVKQDLSIEAACSRLIHALRFEADYQVNVQGGTLTVQRHFGDGSPTREDGEAEPVFRYEYPHAIHFLRKIHRTDSPLPLLVLRFEWSGKEIIVLDWKNGETVKRVPFPGHRTQTSVYTSVYLPETLDRIVCEEYPFSTIKNTPSLVFFASEEAFREQTPRFLWTAPSDDCRLEMAGFLNPDIFAFVTSTFGRYSLTGEERLYLYSFSKDRIIVDRRLTPLIAFSADPVALTDIAVSASGKYLAVSYGGKILVYELGRDQR